MNRFEYVNFILACSFQIKVLLPQQKQRLS